MHIKYIFCTHFTNNDKLVVLQNNNNKKRSWHCIQIYDTNVFLDNRIMKGLFSVSLNYFVYFGQII